MTRVFSNCKYVCLIALLIATVCAHSQNQITTNNSNRWDETATTQKFAQALADFQTEYTQIKPDILKSSSQYAVNELIKVPYDHFLGKLRSLSLPGMMQYVSDTLLSMSSQSGVTVADFIKNCLDKTDNFISTLDRDKASLFVTPFANSFPAGWVLELDLSSLYGVTFVNGVPVTHCTGYPSEFAGGLGVNAINTLYQGRPIGSIAVQTNGSFSRFPRGMYCYTVTTPSKLKHGQGELNLVDADSKTISCTSSTGTLICKAD